MSDLWFFFLTIYYFIFISECNTQVLILTSDFLTWFFSFSCDFFFTIIYLFTRFLFLTHKTCFFPTWFLYFHIMLENYLPHMITLFTYLFESFTSETWTVSSSSSNQARSHIHDKSFPKTLIFHCSRQLFFWNAHILYQLIDIHEKSSASWSRPMQRFPQQQLVYQCVFVSPAMPNKFQSALM